MIRLTRTILPIAIVLSTSLAHAQFSRLKGGSISVGGTGQFSTILESSPSNVNVTARTPAGGLLNETATNQQQFTTNSTGFVTSFQFHPVAFAGIELNYGFNHYSERYAFNYVGSSTVRTASATTDMHEFTAAYQFHPRHIPFQPFVNIGGGAVDFTPREASNQIRGAGLLEAGFDIPTHSKHIGFRIEGRSLYYRAPNFYNSAISTRSWRVTEQPSFSTYYRF